MFSGPAEHWPAWTLSIQTSVDTHVHTVFYSTNFHHGQFFMLGKWKTKETIGLTTTNYSIVVLMVCGAVHGAGNPDCGSVHGADWSSARVTVGSDVCGSVHGAGHPDCGSLHGAFSCLFWENERLTTLFLPGPSLHLRLHTSVIVKTLEISTWITLRDVLV